MSSEEVSPQTTTKLNATIAVAAFIVIFACVAFFVMLDLCLRFCLGRRRGVFSMARTEGLRTHVNLLNKGLDKAVIDTLPVFTYSASSENEGEECTVCLCEFEEGEQGRLLPKCKHMFHTSCIDMWFSSHATCPICRSPVAEEKTETEQVQAGSSETEVSSGEEGAASSSVPHLAIDMSQVAVPEEQQETQVAAAPQKPHLSLDLSKIAPGTVEQQEFRSPVMEGLRSLKRLLSSSSATTASRRWEAASEPHTPQ